MSEQAHGDAHRAEHGNEKKPNSLDDVVKYIGSSIAGAGLGYSAAYLLALPIGLPAVIGAVAVPSLYHVLKKYVFDSDKKDVHADEANAEPHEPAMAGTHNGGH